MLSGREALHSIDKALQTVQEQLQRADEQIQATGRQLVEERQGQKNHYKKLAEIRLDELVSGEVAAGLDAADQRVGELLEERAQALDDLQRQTEEAHRQQEDLERAREDQAASISEAAEALDQAEAAAQQQLQHDQAYLIQLKKTQQADRTAQQAEEKTAQAEQDQIEKGKPYETDPLFSYLQRRGYATSQYSANPLTRFLDRWVARLCGFQDARPNYAMLLEIPRRLREHAERMRVAADSEFEALQALENSAAQSKNVPSLGEAVQEAEHQIDDIDRRIQEAETRIHELLQRRASFAAGEDDFLRQALDTLAGSFERENLKSLAQYAQATVTAEDDLLVQELATIDRQLEQLNQALSEHKRMQQRHLARLQELEQVRSRFKRERYDGVHSGFGNTALLSMILSQFLQGMASSSDLWGTIQREHRYRRIDSDPIFGSGGIRRRRSTWRMPFPSGGGWSGGLGRGGGLGSGGGFRTGGGF